MDGVLAQPTASEALAFGLATPARGQNVFVRGPRGTGRMTMVREALKTVSHHATDRPDRCYVNNFDRPDRPRLLSLPTGEARNFKRLMEQFADFIGSDLPKAMETESLTAERVAIQERIRAGVEELTEPLEQELRRAGMALVPVQQGPITQTVIFPLVEGEPVPPGQLKKLRREGKVSEERIQNFEAHYPEFQKRLEAVSSELLELQRQGLEEIKALFENEARTLLAGYARSLLGRYGNPGVETFIQEVIDDVLETRLQPGRELPEPRDRYGVNIVLEHRPDAKAPVIEEHAPSLTNLLGTVDLKWTVAGPAPADYTCIRPGALLRADGGFLVLDVDDVITEPGAWRALMRCLRTERLEIVPPEMSWLRPQSIVSPEPIDIKVRVVLVGDPRAYYQLDALDPDFRDLFKVLADFDHEISRDEQGIQHYAAVVARICHEEVLPHFDREALAAVVEHGARIASRAGKLTARFGRIADIVRESAFLAQQAAESGVTADRVREAVARTKSRASLPSRKFQELIRAGTIHVDTDGEVVGQVNGLAVMRSGPITYGFPARITASIGPGRAGLINIEGSARLSGSIHTKGFHILGGCLRHLLKAEHPLAFSASIAFEQSYGGIDGDSASGAEMCCLLSALTGVPIRQQYAMTGAIDQFGHLQAIGGVNEKIEGFFDACAFFGLTGNQGVIIPATNAGDLMLRHDVVEAAKEGRFNVFAVETVQHALEILTGVPVGEWGENGYAKGTLLYQAVDEAASYWSRTLASPARLTQVVSEDEDESETDV